jgi:RNA polymerase sigma-70 factor (ECF subfamily)
MLQHSEPRSPEASAPRCAEQAPTNLPDLLLVERARARDTQAWEAIMRRYNQRLFRIARSIVKSTEAAASLVEDTYLLAFSDLEHYETSGKLGAWLSRLAYGQAVTARRAAGTGNGAAAPAGEATEALEAGPPPQKAGEPGVEEPQGLEQAVDGLPEVFRTVFVLRVIEGISGIETAACLGINETTVRTRLYRAQRRLPAGTPARVTAERNTLFELGEERGTGIISRVFARMGS